jgi:hypothetical protein
MLVTQQFVGDDTDRIRTAAPNTWKYLKRHSKTFEKRGSSIYRGKPSFSIFGVGRYSFAPWKVAVSGLYKKLQFVRVGPVDGTPVVFDDTVYFLPCKSDAHASFLHELLTSKPATEFFQSMIFWSEKRPITVELLKKLDLSKLAAELGRKSEYDRFLMEASGPLFDQVEAAA